MKRPLSRSAVGSLTFLLILSVASCRVSGRIKAGQKVSIDPCSLVQAEKIEKVLGGPLAPAERLLRDGLSTDDSYCRYEKKDSGGNGEYFEISAGSETKSELEKSGETVSGLGREAVFRNQERFGLSLHILGHQGALLNIGLAVLGKGEAVLVREIKPLAKDALNTIEKKFPGEDKSEPSAPPLDVCALVTSEDARRLSQSEQANEESGFKEERTGGSSGGRWGCWYFPDEATVIVHLPKDAAAYEATLQTGAPIKGLGVKAYWKAPVREPSFVNGRLYVVTKNGKAFGIDVGFYEADDETHKTLATELAKIILTRI